MFVKSDVIKIILVAGLGIAGGPAVAGEISEALPELELTPYSVTATRWPSKENTTSRSVTIIGKEAIEKMGASSAVEILKRSGVVAYQSFGALGTSNGGMNSTLWIRGVKDGELVLLNGSPIQGPAGKAYDLNTIPASAIERIEILKGAASTLYGADAMSGVINIITKSPKDKPSVDVSMLLGNMEFQDYSASVSLPQFRLSAARQYLGPQEEVSRNFSGKYRFDMEATSNNSVSASAHPAKWLSMDYIGAFNETGWRRIYDAPSTKPVEEVDQTQTKHFGQIIASAASVKAKVFASHEIMRRDPVWKPSLGATDNRNYLAGGELDHMAVLGNTTLRSGLSGTFLGADYKTGFGKHSRRDYAAFVDGSQRFWGRFDVRLGGRYQLIDGEPGTPTHSQFLPSAGLLWAATNRLNLYADSGKAFRVPTFNNLYIDSTVAVGNPDLAPEQGWTHEAGLKFDGKATRARLTGFLMDYTDKIETDRRTSPVSYYNAGSYVSRGVEIEVDQRIMPSLAQHIGGWQVRGTGTFADPVATDPNGKETQAAPKVVAGAGIAFTGGPLSMDVDGQWTASRERELDAYSVMNLLVQYRLWKGVLKLAVDNVFDRRYQTVGNLAYDGSSRYVYYDLGRLVKAGFDVRF